MQTVSQALNALCETKNQAETNQFNLVVWSRRGASVNAARYYFVSEAFGTVSRRADPSFARVHAWNAVT